MMRIIFTLCLIATTISLRAGCCYVTTVSINGHILLRDCLYDPTKIIRPQSCWVGRCYVDNIEGGLFWGNADIYFQPGDSVVLDGIGVITSPGIYTGIYELCDGGVRVDERFRCFYLADTLETHYRYLYDPKFIDSLATVKQNFDDSVPAIFYPNPIKDIATFECFHTTQMPFDFMFYDLQGRFIFSKPVELSDSYQSISIDVSELQSGTYIAKYFINKRQYTRQIVKL